MNEGRKLEQFSLILSWADFYDMSSYMAHIFKQKEKLVGEVIGR